MRGAVWEWIIFSISVSAVFGGKSMSFAEVLFQ